MHPNKLTFDAAIQGIADGHIVKASDVLARAAKRLVWVAEWHIPGCLSESSCIVTTKKAAVDAALDFAGDTPPLGMATALRRSGAFQHRTELFGYVITTIERRRLADLLL